MRANPGNATTTPPHPAASPTRMPPPPSRPTVLRPPVEAAEAEARAAAADSAAAASLAPAIRGPCRASGWARGRVGDVRGDGRPRRARTRHAGVAGVRGVGNEARWRAKAAAGAAGTRARGRRSWREKISSDAATGGDPKRQATGTRPNTQQQVVRSAAPVRAVPGAVAGARRGRITPLGLHLKEAMGMAAPASRGIRTPDVF